MSRLVINDILTDVANSISTVYDKWLNKKITTTLFRKGDGEKYKCFDVNCGKLLEKDRRLELPPVAEFIGDEIRLHMERCNIPLMLCMEYEADDGYKFSQDMYIIEEDRLEECIKLGLTNICSMDFMYKHRGCDCKEERLHLRYYDIDIPKVYNGNGIPGVSDVNSAFTYSCKYGSKNIDMFLFRREEAEFIVLHELMHALGLDMSEVDNYRIGMDVKKARFEDRYDDSIDLKVNEAYCDFWARIVNTIVQLSLKRGTIKRNKLIEVIKAMNVIEKDCMDKVNKIEGIYKVIANKGKVKEETATYSYYVLAGDLYRYRDELFADMNGYKIKYDDQNDLVKAKVREIMMRKKQNLGEDILLKGASMMRGGKI